MTIADVASVDTRTITLAGTATAGQEWVITFAGTDYKHTVATGETLSDVAAGLARRLNAVDGVTAAADALVITMVDLTAGGTLGAPTTTAPGTGNSMAGGTSSASRKVSLAGELVTGDVWSLNVAGTAVTYTAKVGDVPSDVALRTADSNRLARWLRF